MYFKAFPKMLYDFSTTSTQDIKYVTDFFHRVKITQEMIEATGAFQKYLMKDSETAEAISFKIYGTPLYHWTILLANNIKNPYTDFPMSSRTFETYVDSKYGIEGKYEIKYYEDSDGRIVTPISIPSIGDNCVYNPVTGNWEGINISQLKSVTYYDYEFDINESKRAINIIRPQFISGVVQLFEQLMAK